MLRKLPQLTIHNRELAELGLFIEVIATKLLFAVLRYLIFLNDCFSGKQPVQKIRGI